MGGFVDADVDEESGEIHFIGDLTLDGALNLAGVGSLVVGGQAVKLTYERPLGAPAADSATGAHAAVTLTGSPQTVTTEITQPTATGATYGRTLSITSAFGGSDGAASNVTIHGTASDGTAITEVLAVATGAGGTTQGTKAFATITSIVIPSKGVAAAGTISVGTGPLIGLGLIFTLNSVLRCFQDGAISNSFNYETAVAVGATVELNTIEPPSDPDGTAIVIWYAA